MLKGIPALLTPELLKVLCEMGHGDRICIGDCDFPAASVGANSRVIRLDGHNNVDILKAILRLIPLDTYTEHPVKMMELEPCDVGIVKTPVWDTFAQIAAQYDSRGAAAFEKLERFAFYEEAKKCYAVIATSDRQAYSCMILQKGVLDPEDIVL